jgi:hypothetical protein
LFNSDEDEEETNKTFSKSQAEEKAIEKIEIELSDELKNRLFEEYWKNHPHDENQMVAFSYENNIKSIPELIRYETDIAEKFWDSHPN